MSNSVRPHKRLPTKLPRPWDFPGKSTGVGCHCPLRVLKGKRIKECVLPTKLPRRLKNKDQQIQPRVSNHLNILLYGKPKIKEKFSCMPTLFSKWYKNLRLNEQLICAKNPIKCFITWFYQSHSNSISTVITAIWQRKKLRFREYSNLPQYTQLQSIGLAKIFFWIFP